MKQFIVLTAITGERIAIRPSDITYIEECNGANPKIKVGIAEIDWNISAEKHSLSSILKEIEEAIN